jgi:hypothetical protein
MVHFHDEMVDLDYFTGSGWYPDTIVNFNSAREPYHLVSISLIHPFVIIWLT